MRVAGLLNWRWTPAFALVGGSLLFVLLAIVVVPDQLGAGSTAPSAKGSASSRGLFGRAAPSASAHANAHAVEEPDPAAATTATSPADHARERRAPRERRPLHAPGSPGSYLNGPIDRMFAGGNPTPPPPVGDPPPPPAPAATGIVSLTPGAPAPGDAPVPAAPQ